MKKTVKAAAAALILWLGVRAVPALAADTYNDGLLLYYSFNDESVSDGLADVSGNGNDGQAMNDYGKLTVSGGALSFPGPGSYYSDMGAALRLPDGVNDGVTDFTYSAWIYARGSSDGVRFFDFGNRSYTDLTPFGQPTNAYNSFLFEYFPSTGRARFQDRRIAYVYNRDDPVSYVETYFRPYTFTDDWYMFTLTYKKEGVYYVPRLYVNGLPVRDFRSDYACFTRSLCDLGALKGEINGLYVGRNQWSEDGFDVGTNPDYTGMMDEVRLYDRALTDEEVKALYQATLSRDADFSVTGVSVNHGELTLWEGDTYQLSAEINPPNAANKGLRWRTSVGGIVTVGSDGRVTAKKPGEVTVTVTTDDGHLRDRCNITVLPRSSEPLYGLELAGTEASATGMDVRVRVTKLSPRSGTDVLVAAAYDGDGRLAGLATARLVDIPEGQTTALTLTLSAPPDSRLKVFVWDDVDSMIPLSETKK